MYGIWFLRARRYSADPAVCSLSILAPFGGHEYTLSSTNHLFRHFGLNRDRVANMGIAREVCSMAEPFSSAVSRRRFLYAVAVAAAPVSFLARVRTSFGQDGGTIKLDPTPA